MRLMRTILTIFIILVTASVSYSQASNYFPAAPGYKWYFKNTPLDSLNNPQTGMATYQIDSFRSVVNYQGLQASEVVSRSGLTNFNQPGPYTDTNHYNFQSSNAFYYLNVLSYIGSIPGIDSVAFVNFLRSFEAWYNVYRFSQTVNTNYTIFTKDTTLNLDTLTLPLRFAATGRRLNDETVSTPYGNFLSKKFLLTYTLSYGLLPPFLYIPIVTRPDTIYIADGRWRVKEVIPSINVDLTKLGFPFSFSLPGTLTELSMPSTGISNNNQIAEDFTLYQNYPNPFNPSTIINYHLRKAQNIKLSVYDVNGKEVTKLYSGFQNAGTYSLNWNAENFAAGIYYCRLEAGSLIDVRKMILIK